MTRVLVVAGTRPELIKLGPVVRDLREEMDVDYLLTGQHVDDLMVGAGTWRAHPSWPQPDVLVWERRGYPTTEWPERDMADPGRSAISSWYQDRPLPDVVLVQGDTASTLAGAWFARQLVPLVHLEAGLRCFDDSVPEERVRVEVDQQADLLLAPSRLTAAFAQRDSKPSAVVLQVGQTGLQALREAGGTTGPTIANDEPWALLTLHRQAWDLRGDDDVYQWAMAVADELKDHGIRTVWPVHPRWRDEAWRDKSTEWLQMIDPVPYDVMARTLLDSQTQPRLVVTDSGGLVEEAYAVGIPCVIVRNTTERWEPVMHHAAWLCRPNVGTEAMQRGLRLFVEQSPASWDASAYDSPKSTTPSRMVACAMLGFCSKRS